VNFPQPIGTVHRAALEHLAPVHTETFGTLFDRHQVERLRAESAPHIGDESDDAVRFSRICAIMSFSTAGQ
jgi:hypothetical protein